MARRMRAVHLGGRTATWISERSEMRADERESGDKGGISKVKLALGAASLFLFIVGVKRTYQSGEGGAAPVADREDPRRD